MSKDTEIHYRMLVAKTTLEQNLRKILRQAPPTRSCAISSPFLRANLGVTVPKKWDGSPGWVVGALCSTGWVELMDLSILTHIIRVPFRNLQLYFIRDTEIHYRMVEYHDIPF